MSKIRNVFFPVFPVVLLSIAFIYLSGNATTVDPPDKTIRVFYVLPSDVTLDSAYPKGMAGVMKSSQKYFLAQCKYTYKLNNPVAEVVKSPNPKSWFASVDDYWNIVNRGTDEVYRILPTVKADSRRARWKIVVYVDAASPADGGGGGGGWVGLPKHDADGAKIYPKDSARWCGGMVHELGHCFGCPDASSTDGTVMSASFYGWPNCIFNAGHISTMKTLAANDGFWATEITGTTDDFYMSMTTPEQWSPLVRGNQLQVEFTMAQPFMTAIGLYDLAGKRAAAFVPANARQGSNFFIFDLGSLSTGKYVCALEKNGAITQKAVIHKVR